MEKKISIIIPTINRPFELMRLFKSILIQSLKPDEIIVVDDTPSDDAQQACRNFKKRFDKNKTRLIYLRNKTIPSTSIAKNIGVKAAKGDFIFFLDDDVVLDEKYIEYIMQVFEKRQKVLGVMARIVNVKDNNFYQKLLARIFGVTISRKNESKILPFGLVYPDGLTNKLLTCEFICTCACAYRKSIFYTYLFEFDNNLKGQTMKDDIIFSYSIYQKFPGSLLLTPKAKALHLQSVKEKELLKKEELKQLIENQYYFYFNFQPRSWKSDILFFWGNFGTILAYLLKLVLNPSKKEFLAFILIIYYSFCSFFKLSILVIKKLVFFKGRLCYKL